MSFRVKIILLFTILAAVFMGGLVYYFDFYLKDYIKKQTLSYFRVAAEISESAYLAHIDTLKTRTVDWSSDGYIRDIIEKISNASSTEKDLLGRELGAYLRDVKIHYDSSVIIIDVLDESGVVMASSRENRMGENEKVEAEEIHSNIFNDAMSGKFGEAFVSSPIIEMKEFQDPMTHTMARIFSNKTIGANNPTPLNAVLLIHFSDAKRLSELLENGRKNNNISSTDRVLREHYKTVEVYLVDQGKYIITPSYFSGEIKLKQKADIKPVRACLEEHREIAEEYGNYAGLSVVGASMCLKQDNLTLIVEARSDEVFKSLDDSRHRLVVAGILTWLASAGIIIVLTNLLLKNLNIVIVVAEEVAGGNFDMRARINSGDEIGDLASAFNQALDSTARSQRDLRITEARLKETNASLEKKVSERTAKLESLEKSMEEAVAKKTEELQDRLVELEKFKRVTVGRELKMIELKERLENLGGKSDV